MGAYDVPQHGQARAFTAQDTFTLRQHHAPDGRVELPHSGRPWGAGLLLVMVLLLKLTVPRLHSTSQKSACRPQQQQQWHGMAWHDTTRETPT